MDSEIEQAIPHINTVSAPQSNREIWVRYKLKDAEFEGKGLAEEIKPHAMAFLAMVSNETPPMLITNRSDTVQVLEGSDKPVFGDTSLSEKSFANGSHNHSTATLLTFYLKYGWDAKLEKSILKQQEQLLLISYYISTHQNVEVLHLEEYRQAYAQLAELPVKVPANITARLNELVAGEFMRKVGDGYALTHKGKQAVRKLIAGETAE